MLVKDADEERNAKRGFKIKKVKKIRAFAENVNKERGANVAAVQGEHGAGSGQLAGPYITQYAEDKAVVRLGESLDPDMGQESRLAPKLLPKANREQDR